MREEAAIDEQPYVEPEMLTCDLCVPPRVIATVDMADHLGYVHQFAPDFECWPDGEVVDFDDSPDPSDFGCV
jgi:hypothetical protein